MMYKIRQLLLILFLPFLAYSQSVTLSDQAKVSILTCDVGTEVYSLFGHTAIRLQDPALNLDVVYNYGAFDFRTPNFVVRFSRGDLQYFVTVEPYQDFLYQYVYEKRSVWEQELFLPQEKKQQLLENLSAVISSDDRFYTYKFIDRNCTNMAVDIINRTLGERSIQKTGNLNESYREVLFPYFDQHFYEKLGTSVIFGTKVDQKATLLFLPHELMASLKTAKYNGNPLSVQPKELLNYPPQPVRGSWWNNIYTYIGILLLIIMLNKRPLNIAFMVFLGLIGSFFAISGWYSLHGELAKNYNALLFNPLLLLLAFFYWRKNFNAIKMLSLACMVLLAVYVAIVAAKVYFLIALPLIITLAFIYYRMLRNCVTVRGKKG